VSFEVPAAFWALGSLALLILFSLWRQAAARTTVPSLVLWKRIPERNPPIRALRRPRWRLDLLVQALAVAFAVAGLAAPFVLADRPKARRIGIVIDTSARMLGGGRLEKAKAEVRALLDGNLSGDRVSVYAASPSPRKLDLEEVREVHAHVDLAPLIAAARQETERVLVFTDRPVEGAHARLLGGPADNAGIVAFTAADDEVFVRVVRHGAPRPLRIRLAAGELRVEEALPAGKDAWFRRGDYSKAPRVDVSIVPGDGFPLDDAVAATRLEPGRPEVSLTGRAVPLLRRAFESIPGVSIREGPGRAKVSVGVDAPPGPADLRVRLHDPEAGESGSVAVAAHPLTAGLAGREREFGRVGELSPGFRSGEPFLTSGGRPAGVLKGSEIHLAVDLGREDSWATTPSFPIFWTNVMDFATKGAAAFAVIRTGRPYRLPGGDFLEHRAGDFEPGGRPVRTNLLDARESDLGGVERPLAWDPGAPEGREAERRRLGGIAAAAALACVLLAWFLQRRNDG
jgi:hypothetical protein